MMDDVEMQEESHQPSTSVHHPPPGPRDLYLLSIGLIAGLLLGPLVMGRFAPTAYSRVWQGVPVELQQELDMATTEFLAKRKALEATGVTLAAIEEAQAEYQAQIDEIGARMLDAHQAHTYRLWQLLGALVMAAIAVMIVEAAVVERLRGGLVTARYALLAVWVAMAMAQPSLFAELPIVFTGILIVVVLVASLVPLPRRV